MRSAKPRPLKRTGRRGTLAAVTAVLTALAVSTAVAHGDARPQLRDSKGPVWTGAWGTAMQRPVAGSEDWGPNWSQHGFADQSVRQVVRVANGGSALRIRLSNAYGTTPLRITAATVGRSAGDAQVWPGTVRKVTFGGRQGATIAPGRDLVSDAEGLRTSPLEKLTVTLYFAGRTGPATFHRFTTATSYRASGRRLSDPAGDLFKESTNAWYFLSGVEVSGAASPRRGTVVAFGDSLIDGTGATPGADHRFTDKLAERLVADRRPLDVVNAGIGGNRLLNDSPCYGDKATDRFRRDVLDRPGVRTVIIHLGANDIGAPKIADPCMGTAPHVTARQIIDAHKQLIRAAHARGVKAVGATILPMKGALFPVYSEQGEKVRAAVNHWIRAGGAYDAVLDVDRALADPADPTLPRPGYVFKDGLHPNEAGFHAIASAVDLDAL
ncbi:SGNH/GDSL hydrolase family protein [Streptomyces sp. MCA2]|uniref:SGNH/GDSL hydrolase family protein n=1 Tax=Streptomyces sp. MCA2 TaxID=2944805 RepID=UPI00202014A3|nr:SGNH/GDSL hydrolase family protein [Streptomyces sp. MCA2]MCL7490362.1 SGNH/GDSL hydrolase family protein [Streptomyces sp. MCA2]